MPYCPKCLTEYVEGTTECEDCHVPLAAGSPPESHGQTDKENSPGSAGREIGGVLRALVGAGKPEAGEDVRLAQVKTFKGPTALIDADLARNLLRSQGIPSILPGETSAGILPVLEVPLLVAESDVERASAILHDYFGGSGLYLVK